ncbi:unnamed protein product [Brachionus calyciflorus]|uniref:Gamma-butyrobetaine dioxygenase n=1 Tax=Brachionus calyciflorus TaxID=104777 RepID=A0A813N880_9BILA|nr:unnamed protein product [Brachionus calyciflorus]
MYKKLSILNQNSKSLCLIKKIGLPLSLHQQHVEILKINNKKSSLELTIKKENNEKILSFDPHWLRFNCQSIKSRQVSTGQRIIPVDEVPDNLIIDLIEKENENLKIKWNSESKQPESVLPLEYLINNYSSNMDIEERFKPCKDLKFFNFNELVDTNGKRNEEKIYEWLEHLVLYGLAIVKNLPTENNMVKKLAELIAPVQNTIYDQLFDVKVDKNPINIAYSNAPLEFHMDLMYYESAPGIQFLHCLKFDHEINGGESLFTDSFVIAENFGREHPQLFDTLVQIPATFQKIHIDRTRPVYMVYQRPHIVLNHRKNIMAINWAPAFEGPLSNLSQAEIKAYYKAYLAFSKAINSSSKILEYKLQPGDVACFNNRRILHARNGFVQNNGVRHFQGCYLNIDEFKSEALVKEFEIKYSKMGKNVNHVKLNLRNTVVGNNDYF